LVRGLRYDGLEMSSFFALPNDNYGAQTLVFVLSVALLALPLAALIAASLLEDVARQRTSRRLLAPAPLSLRRLRSPILAGKNVHASYVGTIQPYRTRGSAVGEDSHCGMS
jgi:hypothetical protein